MSILYMVSHLTFKKKLQILLVFGDNCTGVLYLDVTHHVGVLFSMKYGSTEHSNVCVIICVSACVHIFFLCCIHDLVSMFVRWLVQVTALNVCWCLHAKHKALCSHAA